MSNSAGMLIIEGNQAKYSVINLGKPMSIPKEDSSIKNIIAFQADFSEFLKQQNVDRIVLCEGGNDSKKMRVRLEFAILSECEKQAADYKTYPTGSCTRLINTSYKKESGREFSEDLSTHNLPKYMGKTLAAGWRFLE